jgi:hypothetical protein
MKDSTAKLGDSHNFGRRVTLRAGRVSKPRTLLWEWLVLAPDSPLRCALAEASKKDSLGPEAFAFLPGLRFFRSKGRTGGEVEQVRLSPLPKLGARRRGELARIVGRALALFSWLGVQDLHWENLVLGLNERGQIVFGPLDVEMILADLSLPVETKLLPDADPEYAEVCRHAAGVRRVLPYLGKPIAAADLLAMASDYLATLAVLERHSGTIARAFAGQGELKNAPIRVCLRGTDEYVRARSLPPWPPLLEAEQEQLARGDIPYFFRLYGQRGIHYYGNRALTEVRRLPMRGDVPQLDPMLSLSRGLRAASRLALRREGLLTLLGAFDDASLTGRFSSDTASVLFAKSRLVVTLADGEEIHSRRDLRAYVGSVYLPCRCGEVRSVFVPAVTICRAARSPRKR